MNYPLKYAFLKTILTICQVNNNATDKFLIIKEESCSDKKATTISFVPAATTQGKSYKRLTLDKIVA